MAVAMEPIDAGHADVASIVVTVEKFCNGINA